MENIKETYERSQQSKNANDTGHYNLMTIGIIIGMVGIMLRFVTDWAFIDILSNIIFIVGIVLSLKAVLNILK